jgi:hypothetical protein
MQDAKSRFPFGPLVKKYEGSVAAAVVDDDDFSRAGVFQKRAYYLDQ